MKTNISRTNGFTLTIITRTNSFTGINITWTGRFTWANLNWTNMFTAGTEETGLDTAEKDNGGEQKLFNLKDSYFVGYQKLFVCYK